MGILKRRPNLKRTIYITIFCFTASLFFAPTGKSAEVLQLQESKIKAGLLYNFLKYTYWPPELFSRPDQPFQVCLLGGDSFDAALAPLQGRTAQQRPINIQNIENSTITTDCNIVFIHKNLQKDLPAILEVLHAYKIMTMSDIPEFATHGGMVEFSQSKDRHIQIYMNYTTIENAGLSVGEELLKLAQVIK